MLQLDLNINIPCILV